MAEYEYSLLNDYNDNLQGLKRKEDEMSALLLKLKKQKGELTNREKILRKSKQRKRMLLAKIKRERELYKNMISELKASARKLRQMIEEAEKAQYSLKGFSKMKRRLPWPVQGRLALPYGSYRDPKFKTPVFRNGIHIRAKEGEIVKSVYPGKVVFADWFKGYGKVVIVSHGEGYYTVYANLSEIFLSKGDIINKGDEIGRVGESGTLSAPALYFEVRYKGKPLNPLQWLKRKKG
jgi:septal ring factor EnvC (AmiA/AmiB activator)